MFLIDDGTRDLFKSLFDLAIFFRKNAIEQVTGH